MSGLKFFCNFFLLLYKLLYFNMHKGDNRKFNFLLLNDMIQPWLHFTQTAEKLKKGGKKRREMKALKVSHVRMDCLRRSTFPLFSPQEHNVATQFSALTKTSLSCWTQLFLPHYNDLTLKGAWLFSQFVTSQIEKSFFWYVGRPQPAVKGNTRACRADDLQRSHPW